MSILVRLIGHLLEIVLLLIFLSLIAIKTSYVQSLIAQEVASYFSEETSSIITIDKVDIQSYDKIAFKGIYIEDVRGDTLLYAKEIKGSIEDLSFEKRHLKINELAIKKTRLNLVKYEGDSTMNLQFLIDYFSPPKKDTVKKEFAVTSDKLKLTDVHFSYHDYNIATKEKGIDFKHLDLNDLNIELSDIAIEKDTINSNIDALSFVDHSGFIVHELSGKAEVSPIESNIADLTLNTSNSNISATRITFNYKGYQDYKDFVKRVKMDFYFNKSKLNTSDLSYFTDAVDGLEESVIFRGNIKGRIRNIRAKHFYLKAFKSTVIDGDYHISGLPNVKDAFVTCSFDEITTNQQDLANIPLPPFNSNNRLTMPMTVKKLGNIHANGSFTGFFNDFVAYGELQSDLGYIRSDVHLTKVDNGNDYQYKGEIVSQEFNLGKMYDIPKVGNISAKLNVNASGVDLDKLHADINGRIHSLTLNDYDYKDFDLKGSFAKNKFKGDFQLFDENISLKYDGVIDFASKVPKINFKAQINKAYLHELNFVQKDISTSLCSKIVVNVKGKSIDEMEGYVSISQASLYTRRADYTLDDMMISAINFDGEKEIVIHSDLLKGKIKGHYDFAELPQNLIAITSGVIPSIYENVDTIKPKRQQKFEFDLTFRDIGNVKKLFFNDLAIEQGTRLHGTYNSDEEHIKAFLFSPYLAWKNQSINDLQLDFEQKNDKIKVEAITKDFAISESWEITSSDFIFNIVNDSVNSKFNWENTAYNTKGDINTQTVLKGPDHLRINMLPSTIQIDTTAWDFNEYAYLEIDTTSLFLNNIEAENGKQFVKFHGHVSENKKDLLKINMNHFELNNLAGIINSKDLKFDGTVTCSGTASNLYGIPEVLASFAIDSLKLNDESLGDVGAKSSLIDKRTLKIEGNLLNDNFKTLDFNGFYFLKKDDNNIDFTLDINKKSMEIFNIFLPEQVSGLKGIAEGHLEIKGTPKEPKLTGNLKVGEGEINIDLLNVNYAFESEVNIYEDMITLDYFPLKDAYGEVAFGNGTFMHTNFTGWNYDFSIYDIDKMLVMNTTEEMNPLYYGSTFVSGTVGVSGYEENMEIFVDVKSEKNTKIHLPLYTSEDVIIQDFVSFVNHDSLEVEKKNKINLEGITMDFQMEVTPDAEMELIFDPIVGDVMKGTGHGDINLVIDPFGNFNMYGQYVIEKADYLFTLQNVINKYFTVEKGGTINWYGNPYDAEINLDAVYTVKTPLYDLMGEKAEFYKDKAVVECHMKLANELFNPEINFDIEVPKADEEVNAVLNSIRNSQQELNKQVFALMVINKFVPPAGSRVSFSDHGNIGIGATTTAELLNHQLSNWLSQINEDFDIGVNYRPGDQISNEELAVAISTQLFNERLILSGNFGVSNGNEANQNPSNLIGDFNIEYKMNEDGTFRVRGFNESNDLDPINASQSPYTQGVGVYYKEDFNKLNETKLFKSISNLFRRKEKEEVEKGEGQNKG